MGCWQCEHLKRINQEGEVCCLLTGSRFIDELYLADHVKDDCPVVEKEVINNVYSKDS